MKVYIASVGLALMVSLTGISEPVIEIKDYEPIDRIDRLTFKRFKAHKPAKAKYVKPVVKKPPERKIVGNKYNWLEQSGINKKEWALVDWLVSKESGWNPNAVNKSSGACGLSQSLPCSKMGSSWNDPVFALKWMDEYVNNRYGGWSGAVSFHKANNWY